jgi:hypothetical protein
MDTDNEHHKIDDRLDTQRDIIRQSLDAIVNDIGMAMRDVGLTFPLYITVRNSGDTLVTIATSLDGDTLGGNAPRRPRPEIGVAGNAPSVQQYGCTTETPIVLDPVLPKRRRLRHRLNLPLAPQRLRGGEPSPSPGCRIGDLVARRRGRRPHRRRDGSLSG